MENEELVTRLTFKNKFHDNLIVEVEADDEEVMIAVSKESDRDSMERAIQLDPDEIDMFIAVLKLYKSKIVK